MDFIIIYARCNDGSDSYFEKILKDTKDYVKLRKGRIN